MGVCVIVLGIPRSGTSTAAGLLHEVLNVPMGSYLMPPMAGVNDKGFFEDMQFVEAHIDLMQAHEDPKIEFQPTRQALENYRNLVRFKEKTHQLWGVKDPKLCFLLPILLDNLKHEPRLVVTYRPFDRCVRSMMPLYGGMSLEHTSMLQARYLCSLSKNLADFKGQRVDLAYDEMVDDTSSCLKRLANLIGIQLSDEQFQKADRFVSRELRHH